MRRVLFYTIILVILFFSFFAVQAHNNESLDQAGFQWRNDDGSESTATDIAANNTDITDVATNAVVRIRFVIDDTSSAATNNQEYEVQFATDAGDNCASAATWTTLTTSSAGWQIVGSANITNQEATTNQEGSFGTFVAGSVQDTSQLSVKISFSDGTDQFTEVEWVMQGNGPANSTQYDFRIVKSGGTALQNYSQCASLTTVAAGNSTPSVSAVDVNGGSDITLTENGTTSVTITATITDDDGCDDVFVNGTTTAVLYREGVTAACSQDLNNCYTNIILTEVGDTCTGGADTTGDASATVEVWYIAEATDASSTFSGETWQTTVKAIDAASASSTATDASPPELNTLLAIDVGGSISYGTVNPSATSTTQTLTVTNTGNYNSTDAQFSGDNLESGANSIAVNNQKYSTTTSEAWDSLDYTLDGTATFRELNITKATDTTSPSTQNNFWAIQVPVGTAVGTYSGTITITAQ